VLSERMREYEERCRKTGENGYDYVRNKAMRGEEIARVVPLEGVRNVEARVHVFSNAAGANEIFETGRMCCI